ncbi:aminotransferase class I/II-fold pyridoxal phosphate-dependent enzyme [Shewanella woodyi]|uniref:8-amino-7-oxononanoate synthase n=1 Tax=Shewanella woodyi (strain ATCC 51908 / MS32) TaxID=392500 RepID=B1KPJ8_SHEWM|nr:8-amino-7-oxononanoate synthase [Shewanella woodyi]ACA86151.1 8-amino-7-oxononanoate synthase [Shewanella woodyi ATCC 51908]
MTNKSLDALSCDRVSLSQKIEIRQAQLKEAGLLRQREKLSVTRGGSDKPAMLFSVEGVDYLNFSSNDYLGLSQSSELVEALNLSANDYGVGSGSSPLVTGYSQAHQQLEQRLCQITGHEAGLLFCSGFSANTALMKTLFDASDNVVADKLIHASIIDGLGDSKARLKRFLHNDLQSAERLLLKYQPQALVTESIFSMDGDRAPLQALSELCHQHEAWLIVDDAHGFGIDAALANKACAVNASLVDIQVVTFGKALGCQGAAILGSQALIDFLVANAREYIYSTALSPTSASLALAAVNLTQTSIQPAMTLADNIAYFRQSCATAQLNLSGSVTPIQPLIIGDADRTLKVAADLKNSGVWVGAIRPPTVPKGSARLRITITALHTRSDIDKLVSALVLALE